MYKGFYLLFFASAAILLTFVVRNQQHLPETGYPSVPYFLTITNPMPTTTCNTSFSFEPFQTDFSNDGLPSKLQFHGRQILDSMKFSILDSNSSLVLRRFSPSCTKGTRWLLSRVSTRDSLEDMDGPLCSYEAYVELIKDSPRIYVYTRFTFLRSVHSRFEFEFSIPEEYSSYEGSSHLGLKKTSWTPSTPKLDLGKGNFSFRFVNEKARLGIGIELSLWGAEVRTWYKDDYVIKKKIKEDAEISSNADGNTNLIVTIDSVDAEQGETLDEDFVIVAASGDDLDPLHYGNYPIYDISETRYFPVEGLSTYDYTSNKDFTLLSPDLHYYGYIWGWSTKINQYYSSLSNYPDSAFHGAVCDQKVRGFERFIETASKYGLIPYTLFPESFRKQTTEPEKYFSDFMFSQAGVPCIDFARELVPELSEAENWQIYLLLDRVKMLFEPDEKMSWTINLPDSSYWFEYSNLWKSEGHIIYVINTHITALRIAACMCALSDSLGNKAEEAFWNDVVKKGTGGLLWFITNPKNWYLAQKGDRELGYSMGAPPLKEYFAYEMKELKYLIDTHLLNYRIDEILAALNKQGLN